MLGLELEEMQNIAEKLEEELDRESRTGSELCWRGENIWTLPSRFLSFPPSKAFNKVIA